MLSYWFRNSIQGFCTNYKKIWMFITVAENIRTSLLWCSKFALPYLVKLIKLIFFFCGFTEQRFLLKLTFLKFTNYCQVLLVVVSYMYICLLWVLVLQFEVTSVLQLLFPNKVVVSFICRIVSGWWWTTTFSSE